MRILIIHRYYWPDTPAYAAMLHIMARRFVEAGHQVSVFSTQPCYNGVYSDPPAPGYEVVDGVEIYRTPLLKESKKTPIRRAINVALFCWSLFFHCLFRFRKYELLTVATFPPAVMGLAVRTICLFTRARYLYHCQDLYPEAALASGVMRRPWLAKIAAAVDRRNCGRAAQVVVLSDDMRETIGQRGVDTGHVRVINNFIIDKYDATVPLEASLQKPAGKFRVLFAGNLGRFQSLDKIMAAARLLQSNESIEFVFVGGGAMLERLKTGSGEMLGHSVKFFPFQPLPVVMRVINDADLSIISLSPGVIDCAYPSKTMSYMESGCRMLAIVEAHSELARLIESEDAGAVCGDATPEKIAAAIDREFERSESGVGADECAKIRTLGAQHFGHAMILQKWLDLLNEIDAGSTSS